jgi:phosphoglycolate phosphatase
MHTSLNGARIAFDLDGTLVDTAPDLVRALNESVVPLGFDPVPVEAVRAMVGRGARALIRRAFVREGRAEPHEDLVEDRLDVFMDAYRADIARHSRPFEGVEAVLDSLTAAGARLSVCTNKPTQLAIPLLDALNMRSRFERVIGPEDAPAKKPDASHLIVAMGGAPIDHACVLVGDSEPDALAAKAAGAGSVIFEGGYSEKPARTLGADRLFDTYGVLPDLLAELIVTRKGA